MGLGTICPRKIGPRTIESWAIELRTMGIANIADNSVVTARSCAYSICKDGHLHSLKLSYLGMPFATILGSGLLGDREHADLV